MQQNNQILFIEDSKLRLQNQTIDEPIQLALIERISCGICFSVILPNTNRYEC